MTVDVPAVQYPVLRHQGPRAPAGAGGLSCCSAVFPGTGWLTAHSKEVLCIDETAPLENGLCWEAVLINVANIPSHDDVSGLVSHQAHSSLHRQALFRSASKYVHICT